MEQRRSDLDEFAHLCEETQTLARGLQDLRHRLAEARRKARSSDRVAAVRAVDPAPRAEAAPERPRRPPSGARLSCVANVARWLPPLDPMPQAANLDGRATDSEAGRYSYVAARKA